MAQKVRTSRASDVQARFGVTRKAVQSWVARGAPCDRPGRGRATMFDLDELAAWMEREGLTGEQGVRADLQPRGATGEPMQRAKLALTILQVERLKLGIEESRGRLVSKAEVESRNVAKARLFRTSLTGLASRLAPVLASMDSVAKVEMRLLQEFEGLLREYARK